jgi:LasA protease
MKLVSTLRRLIGKPGIIWIGPLGLILLTALACNLPERHADPLSFSTDQPQASLTPSVADNNSAQSVITGNPIFPEATSIPGEASNPLINISTATPGIGNPAEWVTPAPGETLPPFVYWTQPGDTLDALAGRFSVSPDQINPNQPMNILLAPGQQLSIPNVLGEPAYPGAVMPDSAVLYSPAAANFVVNDFITQAGGYLSTYREEVDPGEWQSGAEIVERVANESSVNPQLLLALLEFRSGWVSGQLRDPNQVDHPIGFYVPGYLGLYKELSVAAKLLNMGYYGWRLGTFIQLDFPDSTHARLYPGLNPGSVAVENLLSKFYLKRQDWLESINGSNGLPAVYTAMFGDPWQAAALVEPLLDANLQQPTLELPFAPGEAWSLTSGPHIAWRTGTPRGALDFAPITGEPPCAVSSAWVTASASGRVVRAERGMVVVDLDGDGLEQTGWVLVYMHIAERDRIPAGSWVETNSPLGHPSCEGGQATGTHVHLARKYNGEWLAADGPLPMVLSGWTAHAGELSYEGTLTKDGLTISARPDGSSGSTIIR